MKNNKPNFEDLYSTKTESLLRDLGIQKLKSYVNNEQDVLDIGSYNSYHAENLNFKTMILVDVEFEEVKPIKNVYYIKTDCYNFLRANTLKFDFVILAKIIEHIYTPYKFLNMLYDHLNPKARIYINYPNAMSFNRILGTKLGMMTTPYQLSKGDLKAGHKQMYSYEFIKGIDLYTRRRFKVIEEGGFMFKPVTNSMMDKYFRDKLDIFVELGNKFHPRVCAEIWCLLEKQ